MTAVCLDNLRKCADLLHTAVTELNTEPMDTSQLDGAMDSARDMEFDVTALLNAIQSEQWSRPEFWARFFRDDRPLYCAKEITGVIQDLRDVSGRTPKPWHGFLYTLKNEHQSYVMRVFGDGTRDVVPSLQSQTAPICDETIFDDADIIQKGARQLEMTVFRYVTTQTSEERHCAVALCFV